MASRGSMLPRHCNTGWSNETNPDFVCSLGDLKDTKTRLTTKGTKSTKKKEHKGFPSYEVRTDPIRNGARCLRRHRGSDRSAPATRTWFPGEDLSGSPVSGALHPHHLVRTREINSSELQGRSDSWPARRSDRRGLCGRRTQGDVHAAF